MEGGYVCERRDMFVESYLVWSTLPRKGAALGSARHHDRSSGEIKEAKIFSI